MEGSDVAWPPPPAAGTVVPHSPWHSPVPYLFGGLAAMLGLIAFALLVLACSYWKLSGYLDAGRRADSGEAADIEAAAGEGEPNKQKKAAEFEEKIVVIMAGEVKPTFLATPLPSTTSSFSNGDDNHNYVSAPQSKSEVGGEMHVIKELPGNSHVRHHHHQPEQN